MGLQIVIFRLKNIDLGAKYGKNYKYVPKNHLLAGPASNRSCPVGSYKDLGSIRLTNCSYDMRDVVGFF